MFGHFHVEFNTLKNLLLKTMRAAGILCERDSDCTLAFRSHLLRKNERAALLTTPGLRPTLHDTAICRWAKQIWFIAQSGVKSLKGSCYIASADG